MLHPLQQQIAALRSRIRRWMVLYALSWIVSGVLATTLVLGLADYLFRFQDPGLRLMASLGVLAVLGWTVYRFLYRGLTVRLGEVELARRLQRHFPELRGSLASAVQFLRQSDDDPAAGSPAMRRAVIHQTTFVAQRLDFLNVLQLCPVRWAAMMAGAWALAMGIAIGLDPLGSRTALARLVNPLGDVPWPQVHHLSIRSPVERVARGETFRVAVVNAPGVPLPSEVHILYRFENPEGPSVERRKMDLVGGMMVAQRENVSRPFSFRVEGGDDRSMPWQPVEIVDRPAIRSLKVKLTPPPYTGWPPEYAEKNIRALVGTRVEMTGAATKPLVSAALCLEGGVQIPARLTGTDGSFQLPADDAGGLVVEKSGSYWFQLTDREDLASEERAYGEIRAVSDTAPAVSIEEPAANIFVTPRAVVPIRVTAHDDLAIRQIGLEWSRSDQTDKPEAKVPLYTGPASAPPQAAGLSAGAKLGEKRVVVHSWNLETLGLQPGAQVTFWATADDYRPQTGKSRARRLTVITPEELGERIAARQSVILEELSRVLAMQRQGREQVAATEARLQAAGRATQPDVDSLFNAERNQRQVNHLLTSRSEGLPMHVLGLLADLENNNLDSPDVRRWMQALLAEIEQLGRESLPAIGLELTAAIKAAQVHLEEAASESHPRPAAADVHKPLAAAGARQDLVIRSLERMRDELSRWDRFRGFYRDVGQLLREQEELARRCIELSQRTLSKELKDLPPETVAELKLAGYQQRELARRLQNLQQQMGQAVGQLQESDPLEAQTLSDALARARELDPSGRMQAVGDQLERNRMGEAVDQQQQILDHLHEILDILANRRQHELSGLVKKLREAEGELGGIAQRQEELRKQLEQAAGQPDAKARPELDRLAGEQRQLQDQMRRMVQLLERLAVPQALPPAVQASEKMGLASRSAGQAQGRAAALYAEEARKAVEETRRQLDAHRRQNESELAAEQVAQLRQSVEGLHDRQSKALQESRRLEAVQKGDPSLPAGEEPALEELTREQRRLETETTVLSGKTAGIEVFRLALDSAAREMGLAAALLDRRQMAKSTQEAQRNALARLAAMIEALKPAPPPKEPDANPPGKLDQRPRPGQPGGARDVAQLRLLKAMQEEINRRTEALDKASSGGDKSSPETRRQYEALEQQQGRLEESLLALGPSDEGVTAIARDMGKAKTLLGQAESGPSTQQLQRQIVAQLDTLIREAQKRSGAGSPQPSARKVASPLPGGKPKAQPGPDTGKPGTQPAQAANPKAPPGEARGPGAAGLAAAMKRLWGNLPYRQRQQVSQVPGSEEFLPKYEPLLEEYFKRLTEQQDERTAN
jgi:hypothetical protein